MYIIGADLDLQNDLDLIPTEHNFFPAPQSFTLIRESFQPKKKKIPYLTKFNSILNNSPLRKFS